MFHCTARFSHLYSASFVSSGGTFRFSTLLVLLFGSTVCAQTSAPDANSAPEGPAQIPVAQASGAQAEVFNIPDRVRDVEQLMAFVEEVDSFQPSGSGEQEMITHQRKVARTVVAAAEQVFAQKLNDEDAMQSAYLKLQGLRILKELNEPKADQLLTAAIDAAQADQRADVQAVGMKFMVESGFARWTTWGEDEKSRWIKRINEQISKHEPAASQIEMVMVVVDFLGDANGEKHAQALLAKLMPHFQSSQDPQIEQTLTMLAGVQRRMNLPGNAIELTGTMLDGSDLDWSSYRGKVVLVDFWATWCGPCRAEVPNILKMYQAYHEKGFEVLGISLDEESEQAESYLKQTKIPWPTMFSDDPAKRGWSHPMAVRYGITGIPRAILVDREGNVVHMSARGKMLGRELRRLLGEPIARVQSSRDALVQQVSNPPAGK